MRRLVNLLEVEFLFNAIQNQGCAFQVLIDLDAGVGHQFWSILTGQWLYYDLLCVLWDMAQCQLAVPYHELFLCTSLPLSPRSQLPS